MKNKTYNRLFTYLTSAVFILQVISCGTERANVKYEEFKKEMHLSDSKANGAKLGAVEGSRGGAIWDNCTKKAHEAVEEMVASAKSLGATSIGNIVWHPDAQKEPSCRKNWGFFAMPVFILTPLFMSVKVQGDAFKGGKVGVNQYLIPESTDDQEALIQKILANYKN